MAYRLIQVGTGGMGKSWCRQFLPPNVAEGLIEPVAAVDVNAEALIHAREGLGLSPSQCYTDIRQAFAENKADVCTIVVPPTAHEAVVDEALAHGCHILSEKPIADTLEASCRIAVKVRDAGRKMGVTMSHRFRPDITTLRKLIWSGRYGQLDYVVCRFTAAYRELGQWGPFRYQMDHPLLVDGAVHHLDLLVDLASQGTASKCQTIYAQSWNPPWSDFAGDAQALVFMKALSGTRMVYEGALTNATSLNSWFGEYIRAECSQATLIMQDGRIEERLYGTTGTGLPVDLIEQPKWAHTWLIEQFVHWLDGGPPIQTNVWDNLQSMALVFAAIKSSGSGRPVRVQPLLAKALAGVEKRSEP